MNHMWANIPYMEGKAVDEHPMNVPRGHFHMNLDVFIISATWMLYAH